MKQSELKRKTALKASRGLKRRYKPPIIDPARDLWKQPHAGFCQCGCDRFSMHLENHHVVEAQTIRQEHREDLLWDPRNGLLLHPHCHARHTQAFRRVPLAAVPACAVEFAQELLGDERAALYMVRHYRIGEGPNQQKEGACAR